MAGALDLFDEESPQVDLNDVQSRKDIFNRAAQRILESRNAIQQPYGGANMPLLTFGAALTANQGNNSARDFTGAMLAQANAKQAQQQAEQQTEQQRSGMDLRAQMAQILGQGGSLEDVAALGAVGGEDKTADSLAKLSYYGTRGAKSNLPAALQLADEYEKARQAGDIQRMNDIETFAKTLEKNTILDDKGNVVPRPGAPDAAGKLKYGAKAGEKQAEGILHQINQARQPYHH